MEFEEQIGEAEAAIRALEAPARETAEAVEEAFAKAGRSLAGSLSRAAADGKISMRELAAAVIGAVEAAAGGSQGGGQGSGLAEALKQVFGGFSGARAEGGFAGAGGAYLVGERGPEVFRPAVSGTVEAMGSGTNVNVTVVVPGGAEALVRSEAQVVGALHRAVRMGVR